MEGRKRVHLREDSMAGPMRKQERKSGKDIALGFYETSVPEPTGGFPALDHPFITGVMSLLIKVVASLFFAI